MKDSIYNLINPVTNEVLCYGLTLNAYEVGMMNYAFNLNEIKKKYVKVEGKVSSR